MLAYYGGAGLDELLYSHPIFTRIQMPDTKALKSVCCLQVALRKQPDESHIEERTSSLIQGMIHDIHGPPEQCYIREGEVYS